MSFPTGSEIAQFIEGKGPNLILREILQSL